VSLPIVGSRTRDPVDLSSESPMSLALEPMVGILCGAQGIEVYFCGGAMLGMCTPLKLCASCELSRTVQCRLVALYAGLFRR
jgi:hypothetical protein